jgi:syntaxin 1B/2/3
VVKEYQKRQQDYKDDVKKKVTRQVRIVKEDATEEDIEAVMQGGGSTEQLFQQAILTTANDSVKEAFEKAQDKYRYRVFLLWRCCCVPSRLHVLS